MLCPLAIQYGVWQLPDWMQALFYGHLGIGGASKENDYHVSFESNKVMLVELGTTGKYGWFLFD